MTTRLTPLSETRSSIWKDKDNRWHGRVTVARTPAGKAIRRHPTGRTKADVVRKVREIEQLRDSGMLRLSGNEPTLAAFLEHWLTRVVAVKRRHKTWSGYTSHMHKHVIPVLGAVRVRDLTTEMVEDLYAEMVRNGRGQHTVHGVHRTLRSAMSEAVARRHIAINPVTIAAVTVPEETEVEPLTLEESMRLLKAVGDARNGARWSVALALGLRQGESLGLRWCDVDLEAGEIHVRRQSQRVTWKHGCGLDAYGAPTCGRKRGGNCPARYGGGLVSLETKTRVSKRTITLPSPMVDDLLRHRQQQRRERLEAPEWSDPDLVFATPAGGRIDPKHDSKEWHALLEAAGVRRARLHDARHTAATLLLIKGVHPRTVMELMGWSEMRTLARYTHVVDQLRKEAATSISEALWPRHAEDA